MRLIAFLAAVLLVGCQAPPPPVEPPKPDPTKEPWYAETVQDLVELNRQASELFRKGKTGEASDLVMKGQPLANRVLGVPSPTIEAAVAASDLDELYGKMLFSNGHYGWARLFFQKIAARWKTWTPQTEETIRRRKAAEAAIAECDRRLAM